MAGVAVATGTIELTWPMAAVACCYVVSQAAVDTWGSRCAVRSIEAQGKIDHEQLTGSASWGCSRASDFPRPTSACSTGWCSYPDRRLWPHAGVIGLGALWVAGTYLAAHSGLAAMVLFPLLWVWMTGGAGFELAAGVWGIASIGYSIGCERQLNVKIVPPEKKTDYIAAG